MRLRIAKKIVAAVGTDRETAYNIDQIGRADRIVERTPSQKAAGQFFHDLMVGLGVRGRAEILAGSGAPGMAFNLLMRTPMSDWHYGTRPIPQIGKGE